MHYPGVLVCTSHYSKCTSGMFVCTSHYIGVFRMCLCTSHYSGVVWVCEPYAREAHDALSAVPWLSGARADEVGRD